MTINIYNELRKKIINIACPTITITFTGFTYLSSFYIKLLLITYLLLICINSNGQREKIKTYYKNGQLKSKGSTYTYSTFYNIKKLPKKNQLSNRIEKKIKKWKYWYPNGQLSRIEQYKLIINSDPNDLPDGKWSYFNEQGIKYREDIYKDGTFIYFEKEIYQESKLAGKVLYQDGIFDTILYLPFTKDKNLIINPEFDLSINRAESVYNWLINKGIDAKRMTVKGYGKSHPLYNETGEKYRALNRRVEIKIIDRKPE